MGCGKSSAVHVVPGSTAPEVKTDNQQVRVPSARSNGVNQITSASSPKNVTERITSASSQKSITKSIVSVASHTSATNIKPSTSVKKVKNPSIYSEHDVNQNLIIIWVDANIDQTKKIYHD